MQQLSVLSKAEIRETVLESLADYFDRNPIHPATNEDELLNIHQAAQFTGLAPATIYVKVSKNQIPFLKRGKKLYFKKSELLKWIETGRSERV
jgi:excisionase family DNA binding protein